MSSEKSIFITLAMLLILLPRPAQSQGISQTFIGLRVNVDKLRLRATPDKNGAVVAELPENTQLMYLDQTAGAWDEVTLRGQAHKARWYKVKLTNNESVSGWIYGGGVALSSVYVAGDNPIPNLNYDFLTIHTVSKQAYDAVFKQYKNPVLYDTLAWQLNDSTIILPFDNGKKDTLSSHYDEDHTILYTYIGQLPDINVYLLEAAYYEGSEAIIVNKKNGKKTVSYAIPEDIPQLSPDKKWLAMGWENVYEEEGGVQVFAVRPDGIFESSLLTVQHYFSQGACWDAQGRIFFKSYRLDSDYEKKIYQYFCLTIIQR